MKHKRYILTLTVISAILFSGVAAFAGTAYSPKKTKIKIWEPMEYDLGHDCGDALISQLTGVKTQGYDATAVRWQDTEQDGGVEQCARSRWNAVPVDSGVTLVDTHGSRYVVTAATGKYEDEVRGWEDWQGNGSTDANIIVDYWNNQSVWTADVEPAWFNGNWKNTHDANRAIVFWGSCDGAWFCSAGGGRTRFGYVSAVETEEVVNDINKLFGRMNGTVDGGTKRKAGVAFAAGDFDGILGINHGGEDTTLCPAPADWNPKGPGAGQAGTGIIEFDTHCDNAQQAANALTKEILKGEITVNNFRWNENDYELKFDYNTNDCDEDYKVKMIAVANYVKAKDGGQKLDGSKVAPNADNKDWTFED